MLRRPCCARCPTTIRRLRDGQRIVRAANGCRISVRRQAGALEEPPAPVGAHRRRRREHAPRDEAGQHPGQDGQRNRQWHIQREEDRSDHEDDRRGRETGQPQASELAGTEICPADPELVELAQCGAPVSGHGRVEQECLVEGVGSRGKGGDPRRGARPRRLRGRDPGLGVASGLNGGHRVVERQQPGWAAATAARQVGELFLGGGACRTQVGRSALAGQLQRSFVGQCGDVGRGGDEPLVDAELGQAGGQRGDGAFGGGHAGRCRVERRDGCGQLSLQPGGQRVQGDVAGGELRLERGESSSGFLRLRQP